jgi:hypothetical protein
MTCTIGASASAFGTWRRRGTAGSDSRLVGCRGRSVANVLRRELACPTGELEGDSIEILEVDRADEDSGVQVVADAPLALVMIGHVGAVNAGRLAKATWFIDPIALTRLPWSGRPVGPEMPGADGGASGNQKKARASPPPQSKKKCCPMPAGSSMVLTSGIPSTLV